VTALWGYLGLLRGKTFARLAATAILSLLAAVATVGLLALSGGLIASCAIAGSAAAFSIYAPSGEHLRSPGSWPATANGSARTGSVWSG
jgi:ATP-binding cassette, subfamily C, bacterial CydC